MQMGYDFDEGPRGPAPLPRIGLFAGSAVVRGEIAADDLEARHPDWMALRARFSAIHALHHTLAASGESLLPGGGFAASGEAVLHACRERRPVVNPVCSANGKDERVIMKPVAASPTPGDRGML
ncbi:hypothetical protein H7F51_03035 [Novosphingobium flavum]|uniref:Uncharacterized protein n=1 Tax=Novosphingobium flavum TaxID=1778672 RepID=A0A7X1FPD0_9SPHN|nr:hypothetical protein [Novosphingobium flavum]MBC2664490.1 hypothetical protein [Novosphingobium flavum]